MPIRVAILGDDPFFRQGLRQLLSTDAAFAVLDYDIQASAPAAASVCDVILVDSRVDGATARCAQFEPDERPFRIFLMVPSEATAVEALAAGARGIVRTADPLAHVPEAIRVVHSGSVWAPRRVLVDAWLRHRQGAPAVEQLLSAREYEVVQSLALGMSNKELAAHLGISMATVKAHLTHVFQKLGLNGRGELIAAYHGRTTRPRRSS